MLDWRRAALEFHRVWQPQWVYKGAPKSIKLDYLDGSPPFIGVEVQRTSNQNIATDTHTAITWQQVNYDTGSPVFWTSGSTLVAPRDGVYLVTGSAQWNDGTGGGDRQWAIQIDSTFLATYVITTAPLFASNQVVWFGWLTKGSFAELVVRQSSGGDLEILGGNSDTDSIGVTFRMMQVGSAFQVLS